MPRGKTIPTGATRVSPNGYHYTKVKGGKQRLTHHIIAEQQLGREIDTEEERVIFKDGNRKNLDPDNILVVSKKKGKKQTLLKLKRDAQLLENQIADLEDREPRTLFTKE